MITFPMSGRTGWKTHTDLLFTAEYAGHAVGIARIAHVAPKQWWLEGLRVDPEFQDKKIGSALHEYMTEWWLEKGDGTVRLWTNAKRVKVHHLCEKLGFVHTQERAIYAAPPLDEPENSFIPVAEQEISEAVAFLPRISCAPVHRRVDGRRLANIRPSREFPCGNCSVHGTGACCGGGEGRDWSACGRTKTKSASTPCYRWRSALSQTCPSMLQDLRRQTAREGKHKVAWNANVSPELDRLPGIRRLQP